MALELREWRALAIGWAAGIGLALWLGIHWLVPVGAISVALLVHKWWR